MSVDAPTLGFDRERIIGLSLVMLAGTFWSTSGMFVRSMEEVDAWQLLFYRSISVVVAAGLYFAWRQRGRSFAVLRNEARLSLIGGFFLAVASAGFVFALFYTTVANAVFMLAAGPFMTAILAWFILKEPIRKATWITMCIAGFGVAYMVQGGVEAGRWLGNVTALISVAGFACYAVTLRQASSRDSKRETMPVVIVGGLMTALFGAVMLESFSVNLHDLLLCLLMGVVQIVLGMVLFLKGASRVSAAELSLLSLTEVVLSPGWVWMFYGEVPETTTAIGGGLVMVAVLLRAVSGLRRRPTWRSV
ncbi:MULTISPECIES: DMT family transporter [Limibacillus]|uniref:Drug/metabolite transporter (DMT)-like permease n=1 Tax=Limibacillus halophilus TaxID=1579333 RepID=A0A839SZN1_9PROT|nr:DMT family transporter [Limibacillus halophilus]MBB3066363.1 drug/metabolite transporter (DMT)-like permease [Limibacillus halophilus]